MSSSSPSHPRRCARALLAVVLASAAASCLAAPPPIVVDTPFGAVRAESQEKADEVARLLEELAPRVQELLPGSQDRSIEIWVQNELRVYRHQKRPESVRGFTLLSEEFRARRIHLQDDGQSPWYLAHELVHALIGESWKTLPGILEEGLGDVVAEALNPDYSDHIRAHRLLNAAVVAGGFEVGISYGVPSDEQPPSLWERRAHTLEIRAADADAGGSPPTRRLLETSRAELHRDWPEIPESLYGFAWLVTSRIVERVGLEGLHELCLEADAQGLELVPIEWLEDAADMDFDRLDPRFLGSCFGRREMIAAAYLQTEAFADMALEIFRPLQPHYRRGTLNRMQAAFELADGSRIPFRSVRPLSYGIYVGWRENAPKLTTAQAAPAGTGAGAAR